MSELSTPTHRTLAHTRVIRCRGYEREDGLWDVEAHLEDTKPTSVTDPIFGTVRPAGVPLHSMKIRITVDEDMLVHGAEAVTINAPFSPCSKPPAAFSQLQGVRLGPGWKKQVSAIMGRGEGCTHLKELLTVLVTVAFQVINSSPKSRSRTKSGQKAPFYLGTCEAYRLDGEVVAEHYPEMFTPPK